MDGGTADDAVALGPGATDGHIVMAYIVMAYIVMAYVVMAFIVLIFSYGLVGGMGGEWRLAAVHTYSYGPI